MAIRLVFPDQMDMQGLCKIQEEECDAAEVLGADSSRVGVIVDLSNVAFFTPAGVAAVHEIVKSKNEPVAIIRPVLSDAFRYAQRLGLFDSLNAFLEKDFNSHPAENRFKEITVISRESLHGRGRVDTLSRDMVDVVCPGDDNELKDILLFCVSEMINNVIQHSGKLGVVCAQYYPCNGNVEVAIADHGMGLRRALQENPDYEIESDEDAIELALQPDTSGTFKRPKGPYDIDVNTGNGLYYLKSIIALSYGYLDIWSGCARYSQDGNKPPVMEEAREFQGTLVAFRIARDIAPPLQEQLAEIRAQSIGDAEAVDIHFE